MERLDKILASQGVGSRKECAALIRRGEVAVNGAAARRPEQKADPEHDAIAVRGAPLCYRRTVTLMMNKPGGVLSATRDPHGVTVLDLLPPEQRARGLFPAGRLDRDTEGLLLLTNDGALAHRMLAPKSHVWKRYLARVDGPLSAQDAQAFAAGLALEGMVCLPASLEILEPGPQALAVAAVREGKFHQVKRMFLARGRRVLSLRRIAVGGLSLDPSLPPGAARPLTPEELELIWVPSSPFPQA